MTTMMPQMKLPNRTGHGIPCWPCAVSSPGQALNGFVVRID